MKYLSLIAAWVCLIGIASAEPDDAHKFGYRVDAETPAILQAYRESHRGFADLPKSYQTTKLPKYVSLADEFRRAYDRELQPFHQTVGDCVSQGFGMGVWLRAVYQYNHHHNTRLPKVCIATEPIYAASRVEIGGGGIRTGDGSLGIWGAQALQQYGCVLRKKFGQIDLTTYSGQRAREWGRRGVGVPDELEPFMEPHKCETAHVMNVEQAYRALAKGCPVVVCSTQGFNDVRDDQGFLRPRGMWAHCMVIIGYTREGRRGFIILNSWGPDWVSGPEGKHDIPPGSFLVDEHVVQGMLANTGDSHAILNYTGKPRRNLDYLLITKVEPEYQTAP